MAPTAATEHHVDSIAISEAQWRAMLAEPMLGAPFYGLDRRNSRRVSYRKVGRLLIRLGILGRRSKRYLVRTRDVSAEGVGFFHSEPLPVGTHCELALLTIHQEIRRCTGQVAVCQPCEEGVWRVGVRLNGMLDGRDFLPTHRRAETPSS